MFRVFKFKGGQGFHEVYPFVPSHLVAAHVVVCEDTQHPEGVAPVDDRVLKQLTLRGPLHLPQGLQEHIALLADVLRGLIRQRLQIGLAVGELAELCLAHHDEKLGNVGGERGLWSGSACADSRV